MNTRIFTYANSLVLLSLCGPATAQEFAPLGARWVYYSADEANNLHLDRVEVSRDTVVLGRESRVLEKSSLNTSGQRENIVQEIVHTSGDSVYALVIDEFRLVFDFAAESGDTLTVLPAPFDGLFYRSTGRSRPANFVYQVDSLSRIIQDGDTLDVQDVSYVETPFDYELTGGTWGFQTIDEFYDGIPARIVRGIGSIGSVSPFGLSSDLTYFNGPPILACYSDSTRVYNFGGIDCDSLVQAHTGTVATRESAQAEFGVSPSPFETSVTIDHAGTLASVEVRDVTGRLWYRQRDSPGLLELGHLPGGLYSVRVRDATGGYGTRLIVKR